MMQPRINPLVVWGEILRTVVLSGGMPEHRHSMPRSSSLARLRELGGFAVQMGVGTSDPVGSAVEKMDRDVSYALLVNQCVLTLPKTDQACLAKRYIENLSVAVIAADYNIQEQSMHNKLSAAKQHVCRQLDHLLANRRAGQWGGPEAEPEPEKPKRKARSKAQSKAPVKEKAPARRSRNSHAEAITWPA